MRLDVGVMGGQRSDAVERHALLAYPLQRLALQFLVERDARSLDNAAIVTPKRQVGRNPYLASAQYMNLYLINT